MADWLTNPPTIVSKQFRAEPGRPVVIIVRIRFTDADTPPAEPIEIVYERSGPTALQDLQRSIFEDRRTLQQFDAIPDTDGAVVPAPPVETPPAQAAAEAQYLADLHALKALRHLQAIGITNIGGATIAAAITARVNAILPQIDTPAKAAAAILITPEGP